MNQEENQRLMSEMNYYQDLLKQIESGLTNLEKTRQDLKDFEKEKSKEVLAPIAHGVYVEAEIKKKDLFVNIGSDVVAKKSVSDTIKIIDKQEKEILGDKKKVSAKLQEIYVKLQNTGE